tara:strand:- start:81 stop:812 length:732 start_codon:yes stop_codon:yes gene_type:complete
LIPKLNKYSQIDHSKTYQKFNLRNIPHILRLSKHLQILRKYKSKKFYSYADFGCSNGYVTNIISKKIKALKTVGYDHSLNLDIARKKYASYEFNFYDLNIPKLNVEKYDLVTCFETLEHVGSITSAIKNLINSLNDKGLIIISVPIETGLIGLIKFTIKRLLYKDRYNLSKPEFEYVKALFMNRDISSFRDKDATHYGPHLGFDFRIIDGILNKELKIDFKAFNSLTTRYYLIDNDKNSFKKK